MMISAGMKMRQPAQGLQERGARIENSRLRANLLWRESPQARLSFVNRAATQQLAGSATRRITMSKVFDNGLEGGSRGCASCYPRSAASVRSDNVRPECYSLHDDERQCEI